jgi:hypothetical protein
MNVDFNQNEDENISHNDYRIRDNLNLSQNLNISLSSMNHVLRVSIREQNIEYIQDN